MSSQDVKFEALSDPLERLEAIGRMGTPSPGPVPFGNEEEGDTYANVEEEEGVDEITEEGSADQALALEMFDLINHQDIWNISALQSQVYALYAPYTWKHALYIAKTDAVTLCEQTGGD